MELYHPTLPGRVLTVDETVRGWFRSGWRKWDALTGDEQTAHEDAVAAAEAEAAKDEIESAPTGDASTEKE